jgi:hypothetical protein
VLLYIKVVRGRGRTAEEGTEASCVLVFNSVFHLDMYKRSRDLIKPTFRNLKLRFSSLMTVDPAWSDA